MELVLKRSFRGAEYTIGHLYIDGQYFCDTLERPWINNEPQVSCIPTGEYQVRLVYSPKFKRILPSVCNVPNRAGILIHRFNKAEESRGCIGVGLNTSKGIITSSSIYEQKLVSLLKGVQDIKLIIE